MVEVDSVKLMELRVLDGPNLYFTRPAIKVTLGAAPWLALPERRVHQLSAHAGFTPVANPGPAGSDQRRRFVARLAVHLTRALAESIAAGAPVLEVDLREVEYLDSCTIEALL